MPNYDYANSAGLTALSERTFEKIKKEITTDTVTSEAENPLVIETAAAQKAKSSVVILEPVQDLHGQANPYPAGGGKNLLPLTVSNVKSRNTDGTWNGNTYTYRGITFTLNANEDGSITSIVVNGTANNNNANLYLYPATQSQNFPFGGMILSGGVYGGAYIQIELVNSPYTSYAKATGSDSIIDSAVSQQGTATINVFARVVAGETVSNAVFKPMIRLSSVSDATFAPYSNICPIGGLDEVTVERTGFNLWDEEWEQGDLYDATGLPHTNADRIRSKNYIPVAPGATYYFKTPSAYTETIELVCFDKNKQWVATGGVHSSTRLYNVPSNVYYIKFYTKSAYGGTYNHDICINISDASKNGAYEPYQKFSAEVPLPATIYGGTLNLETGELVCDMAMVDLGTLTWTYKSNYLTFEAVLPNSKAGIYREVADILCEQYASMSHAALDASSYGCAIGSSTTTLIVKDASYTDAATFKTAMSGVQLAYELATPITYHLTPAQLDLLKGTNVITVNGKTIQVTYREGLLATLEELNALESASQHLPIVLRDGMLQVVYDDGL